MSFKVKFSGNSKALKKALEKAPTVVRKHVNKASKIIGMQGVALARKEISGGSYAPNAPLTIALKGVNEPLIGDRTGSPLFKAITSKVVNDNTVFVGILQKDGEYNIAVAIHEGATIKVTQKMRNMFYILWRKETDPSINLTGRAKELWDKMPGGWKPLNESTKAINIPSRPFIKNALDSDEFRKFAENIYNQAVGTAIKEIGKIK